MNPSENNLFPFKTPEENLAYTLIVDAKDTIVNKVYEDLGKGFFMDWKEDLDWLMSDEEELPDSISFVDCCNILQWDHKIVRKYYLGLIEEGK